MSRERAKLEYRRRGALVGTSARIRGVLVLRVLPIVMTISWLVTYHTGLNWRPVVAGRQCEFEIANSLVIATIYRQDFAPLSAGSIGEQKGFQSLGYCSNASFF